MKFFIQWQDQFRKWHQYQTVHHLPSASRSAEERAHRTGKRHRIVNEHGGLEDLFNP